MDVQRKKGILEVCVLAVLKKGPSYGYMIIREMERCIEISESTLYPILKRLEQNGCLKTYRQEYNGRMRKYYELTEAGQHKIDQFLDEWNELKEMYQFVSEENRKTPSENESMEPQPEVAAGQYTEMQPEVEVVQNLEYQSETQLEGDRTSGDEMNYEEGMER